MTITAGMTSSSFDVDIIDNMIQDGDKMFTITIRPISTCLSVTINSDTTTVTIIDDEGQYCYMYSTTQYVIVLFCSIVLRIQFVSNYFSGKENSRNILITIIMTGGILQQSISVGIHFSELSATS